MDYFVCGNDRHRNSESTCSGTGAVQGFNGASAVRSHKTNTRMTDAEIQEGRFPVSVDDFSIRSGSGGGGAFPGVMALRANRGLSNP